MVQVHHYHLVEFLFLFSVYNLSLIHISEPTRP